MSHPPNAAHPVPDCPVEVSDDHIRVASFAYIEAYNGVPCKTADGWVPLFFNDFYRPDGMSDADWERFAAYMSMIKCGEYVRNRESPIDPMEL